MPGPQGPARISVRGDRARPVPPMLPCKVFNEGNSQRGRTWRLLVRPSLRCRPMATASIPSSPSSSTPAVELSCTRTASAARVSSSTKFPPTASSRSALPAVIAVTSTPAPSALIPLRLTSSRRNSRQAHLFPAPFCPSSHASATAPASPMEFPESTSVSSVHVPVPSAADSTHAPAAWISFSARSKSHRTPPPAAPATVLAIASPPPTPRSTNRKSRRRSARPPAKAPSVRACTPCGPRARRPRVTTPPCRTQHLLGKRCVQGALRRLDRKGEGYTVAPMLRLRLRSSSQRSAAASALASALQPTVETLLRARRSAQTRGARPPRAHSADASAAAPESPIALSVRSIDVIAAPLVSAAASFLAPCDGVRALRHGATEFQESCFGCTGPDPAGCCRRH